VCEESVQQPDPTSAPAPTQPPPHPPPLPLPPPLPPRFFPQGLDVFEEKLLSIYLLGFQDQVCAVRTRATACLHDVVTQTSEAWMVERVLPKLIELFLEKDNTYLQRICALQATGKVLLKCSSSATVATALPMFEQGALDAVPNVRSACAQVLGDMLASKQELLSKAQVEGVVRPALARLSSEGEADAEVKLVAGKALKCSAQ
jgi:hypothetical protein